MNYLSRRATVLTARLLLLLLLLLSSPHGSLLLLGRYDVVEWMISDALTQALDPRRTLLSGAGGHSVKKDRDHY